MKEAKKRKANNFLRANPAANGRILIVDDEETVREIISSMLMSAEYPCRAVCGGLEALALLESGEKFELLLSDICNEPLDGFGLLEHMTEKFPDVPVVIVSSGHEISVAAVKRGAYDYLLKPFMREQLLIVVGRALEYRRLKLENRAYRAKLAKKNSGVSRVRK